MSDRVIRDRRDAGQPLAGLLDRYRGRLDVVVLGLPRGGVPVASEVARALGAPLDVFVVCKLDVPGREELAMGAIARAGMIVSNVVVGWCGRRTATSWRSTRSSTSSPAHAAHQQDQPEDLPKIR